MNSWRPGVPWRPVGVHSIRLLLAVPDIFLYLGRQDGKEDEIFSFLLEMVTTPGATHLFKTALHTGKTSVENTLTIWIDRVKINSDNRQYHKLFFEVRYALW